MTNPSSKVGESPIVKMLHGYLKDQDEAISWGSSNGMNWLGIWSEDVETIVEKISLMDAQAAEIERLTDTQRMILESSSHWQKLYVAVEASNASLKGELAEAVEGLRLIAEYVQATGNLDHYMNIPFAVLCRWNEEGNKERELERSNAALVKRVGKLETALRLALPAVKAAHKEATLSPNTPGDWWEWYEELQAVEAALAPAEEKKAANRPEEGKDGE